MANHVKYGIAVFADMQGAFDTMWRKGALSKLHKADITNNLFQSFPAFSLTDSIET